MNRLLWAGSLGQYICISIKGSISLKSVHMTGTWLNDVTHHLPSTRPWKSNVSYSNIHNKCDKTSKIINGFLLKKGYFTWFYTKYSLFTITNNIFGHFVDWQLACEDVNKVGRKFDQDICVRAIIWRYSDITGNMVTPIIGNRVMQDSSNKPVDRELEFSLLSAC